MFSWLKDLDWFIRQSYGQEVGEVNHLLVVNSVGQLDSWQLAVGNLEPGTRNLLLKVLQYRLAPRSHLQLLVYVAYVGPYRFGADEQLGGYLLVEKAFYQIA